MSPIFFSPTPYFHNTLLSLQGNELPVVTDTPPPSEPPVSTSISRELIDRIIIIFEAAYFCFRAVLYEPCFLLAHSVVTIIKMPVFLSVLTFNGFNHFLGKESYTNVDIQESFLKMYLHAIRIVQYTFSALTFLFAGIPFSPMKARLFKHHEIKLEDYKIALQPTTEEASEEITPTTPRSSSPMILTQDAETITDYLFGDFPDIQDLSAGDGEIIGTNDVEDFLTIEETEPNTNQNPPIIAAPLKEGAIDLTCIDTYRKYYINELIGKLKVEIKHNKLNKINNPNVETTTTQPEKNTLKPRELSFIFSPQSQRNGTPGSLPSDSILLPRATSTPASYSVITPLKRIAEETMATLTTIPNHSVATPSPLNGVSISSISQPELLQSPPSAASLAREELIKQLKSLRSVRLAENATKPLFLPPDYDSVADFQKAVFANGIRPKASKEQIIALKMLPEQGPHPEGEQINLKNDLMEKIQYYYDLLVPLILKSEILKGDIPSTSWETAQDFKEILNIKIRWRFYQLSLKELHTADEEVFKFIYAYQDVSIIRFLSQLKEVELEATNFYLPNLETQATS